MQELKKIKDDNKAALNQYLKNGYLKNNALLVRKHESLIEKPELRQLDHSLSKQVKINLERLQLKSQRN